MTMMLRHKMGRNCFLSSMTIMLLLQVHYCYSSSSIYMGNFTTDQSALLALKAHITVDPRNILATNWSTTSPICNWVGVTCGVRHLRVTALNLSYMGLTGAIPPHLGNLSFVIVLDFQYNNFHGALPPELSRLRRLKSISFGYNNFVGTIPLWFGSFPKLESLNLFGNQFSGSLPSSIFNLSSLQVMTLNNNHVSGRIPREIGNLTMLKVIYFDHNNFTEIPNEIGTLHELELLSVQFNALKGPVPSAVFNLSSLITLSLYGNSLNGSIPDNICQHLPRIQELNLGNNRLHGPLASKLWQCRELLGLTLEANHFGGSIPKNIGNLTQLTYIYLGENNLTGIIPDDIGSLQNLQSLDLQKNNLNGPIPSTIFNISTITWISLVSNQLSGSLPANIGLGLPNLETLLIGLNELSGGITNYISNTSKLIQLDLGMNSFSGFIPSALCSLANLQLLSLVRNNFRIDTSTPEANILSCLDNLRNLRILSLATNPLRATLPFSFGNLSTSLTDIDLSMCNIWGSLPNNIGNLSSLISLYLGYNQLSGSIPTSIGRLRNLQGLSLFENKMREYIPHELCQQVKLGELDLGDNQLSGSIPSCLGNLSATLRLLSLESNLLNSTVPSTLWGLTDILYLDLSSNLIHGYLPEDIGKLKVVIDLNLSNNHLSGSVPASIGSLQALVNLSMANNKLDGPVPSSFGDLLSLERLDLSRNNLSGEIPMSLEALLYLKNLNLSFNKLQGEIPTGGPFQNFSAQSFLSNGALCGAARLHVPPCKNSTHKPIWRKAKYVILGILSTILLLVAFVSMWILRRKSNVEVAQETTLLPQLLWRRISHLELLRETNGFNESNLLGSGGFGSVYRATLADGTDIAVKVFNLQLEEAFKSFESECETLSNVRHRNLIKIISCCSEINFKALVLDYMPNGSLEKWLYNSQNFSLNILQRLNITIDVALALEYLHHGYSTPIVHCDVKPSNILLDDDMVAHVSDFGIARLLGGEESLTQTMTMATIGYMAPEYGSEGIVSTRGDVYSFGIVVMETFTKRKPTDEMFVGEMNLKQWIANSLLADAIVEVVDATLLGTHQEDEDDDFVTNKDCLSSIMRLALACSAESPQGRINMQDALVTLKKIKTKFLKDAAARAQPS